MAEMTLAELAEKIGHIDLCVLTTKAADGSLAGRPMSNNGDVTYDGTSYFFTDDSTHTVGEIEKDANVGLAFQGAQKLFMGNKFYVFVEGQATLVKDKATFQSHWTPELDKWFDNGIDTPGITMIQVKAQRIKYWDGLKSGDVTL